tara:strand:+ start:1 stop:975 length:975 start_codon:yes stop_codon:yes gene_type:complete
MLLFGASPALDASFVDGVRHDLGRFGERSWFGEHATSLRMGDLGYHNNAQSSLNICFNKLSTYTQTLERAIHTNWPAYEALGTQRDGKFIQINTSVLQIENEYYSAVRPKRTAKSGEKPIHALESRGVEYIEVRCLDLDPFSPVGVSEAQVDFLDLFLLDCLLSESPQIDDAECSMLDDNYKDVVTKGRNHELTLCRAGERTPIGEAATEILDRLESLAEILDGWNGGEVYRKALSAQQDVLSGDSQVPSARVIDAMQASGLGHRDWTMDMALKHQNTLRQEGMDASVEAAFTAATKDSLTEQKRIEASDTLAFSDFLEQYLRS